MTSSAGVTRCARRTSASKDTAAGALRRLAGAGLVERRRQHRAGGRFGAGSYVLHLPAGLATNALAAVAIPAAPTTPLPVTRRRPTRSSRPSPPQLQRHDQLTLLNHAQDPSRVSDIIDVGEASGVVEGISLRTTRLRAVDGTVWHAPNGDIRRVGNKSQQWSRALIDFDVAYQTDLAPGQGDHQADGRSVWKDEKLGRSVLEEPEVWGVEAFGPDGVAIRLVIKTRPADQWKVMRELRQRMKEAFDEEGIEIPFPQRTVWVRADDGGGADTDAHVLSNAQRALAPDPRPPLSQVRPSGSTGWRLKAFSFFRVLGTAGTAGP
jgi:hypothetical protein